MRLNPLSLSLAAIVFALALPARTFEIALWRGETTTALVEDFARIGAAPAGIAIRLGTLESVKYARNPHALQREETFDRVVWGANGNGPQVIEVTASVDAKSGVYPCGNLNIRVVDRVLPPAKDWKYFLDLWQHPWAVARIAGVEPFSPAHYAAMRPIYELLSSSGQKTLTLTLVPEAWDHQCYDAYGSMIGRVKRADGSWTFDYSRFDEYVAFGLSCGLGPKLSCYTMCPWGYVCRYNDETGNTHAVVCRPGTPAFEDYWGAFLKDFSRHLRAKGWFDDTYISMDERSIEDVRTIGEFVERHAPGMKLSMAGNRLPSEYGVTIDNFCMALEHVRPALIAEAAARRERGMITTYYVCCVPTHPNTFMWSAPGEAFWLGVYPAMAGLDGFLRWAWNSWPKNPVVDATFGNWHSGDTFLVYPGGEPSWRFLELRNGIVAAEKIRILNGQGLFSAELKKLSLLCRPDEAVANRSDFLRLRRSILDLVNR